MWGIKMTANFDEAAKKWDLDGKKIKRAKDVAEDILKHLPDTRGMSGMEHGCGTGLLGLGLLPYFKEMTFSDTSTGMIEEVEKKIKEANHQNCRTVLIDPEKPMNTSVKYDCIFNLMVLHHIPDTEETIKKWSKTLNRGGYLCIADLITEDGSFHGGNFDGHLGFDPEKLGELFRENNLSVESITTPHTIKREDSEGSTREYPLFLMIGRKG